MRKLTETGLQCLKGQTETMEASVQFKIINTSIALKNVLLQEFCHWSANQLYGAFWSKRRG